MEELKQLLLSEFTDKEPLKECIDRLHDENKIDILDWHMLDFYVYESLLYSILESEEYDDRKSFKENWINIKLI